MTSLHLAGNFRAFLTRHAATLDEPNRAAVLRAADVIDQQRANYEMAVRREEILLGKLSIVRHLLSEAVEYLIDAHPNGDSKFIQQCREALAAVVLASEPPAGTRWIHYLDKDGNVLESRPTPGVEASEPWSIEVHCSKGKRTLRAGMRWRDGLYGSTWEVVEPKGGRIYSPSGLGGTPTFWCKPVGELPEGAKRWLEQAREDGCVSFCGDSIAAGLIADGVGVGSGETFSRQTPMDSGS